MKHKFENGKWKPDNGTFVKVPNEQIPEVVQMLRDNGYETGNDVDPLDNCFIIGAYGVFLTWQLNAEIWKNDTELPFPDFKALVTGKLPESWCIQCTEESMKSGKWEDMIESINGQRIITECHWNWYYGRNYRDLTYTHSHLEPFGEVLQIETWAAVEEMNATIKESLIVQSDAKDNLVSSTNSEIGSIHWRRTLLSRHLHMGEYLMEKTPDDKTLRVWAEDLFSSSKELLAGFDSVDNSLSTDDQLIAEVKRRGYTISKIY